MTAQSTALETFDTITCPHCGGEFPLGEAVTHRLRAQLQAIVEAFEEMRRDLESERRAIERQWAKREKQLTTVIQTTARLYGDLQGLAGAQALPDIEALALGDSEAGT